MLSWSSLSVCLSLSPLAHNHDDEDDDDDDEDEEDDDGDEGADDYRPSDFSSLSVVERTSYSFLSGFSLSFTL